jgi:hypothetical protein
MGMRFRNVFSVFMVTVASLSALAASAIAEPKNTSNSQPVRSEPLPDTFNRAFFNESGDLFRNNGLEGQIRYIFGPGTLLRPGFPEDQEVRDAQVLHELYRDVLDQQISGAPIIRTPDLPNPFNTSILMMPPRASGRVRGSEFIYEKAPLR